MPDSKQGSPLVSIVTPTFNRERFIGEAIDSVISQSYPNWELLIIDDGSTDETRALVDTYLLDKRIKYFYQSNSGQAKARNKGVQVATGEFIAFLDSDNRWKQGKLQEQVKLLQSRSDIDVIYGDGHRIDEHGSFVTDKNMRRYSGQITEHLLRDNCVSFNTAICRSEAIARVNGFDETVRRGDDYDLWLRMSVFSNFLYVPRFWSDYRVMDDQISSNKEGRFESNWRVIQNFFEKNPEFATKKTQDSTKYWFLVRRGRQRLSAGLYGKAFDDLYHAIKINPFAIPGWRAMAKFLLMATFARKTPNHSE